jgi:hypothetical protein
MRSFNILIHKSSQNEVDDFIKTLIEKQYKNEFNYWFETLNEMDNEETLGAFWETFACDPSVIVLIKYFLCNPG